jgi:hypothetical protein
MAKKQHDGSLPLPDEWLDRGLAVLEGPLNRVVERVWKSRLVVVPLGLTFKVTTVVWGRMLHGKKPPRSR